NKIYMFNKNLGFHCDYNTSSYTRRTTDGGLNWTNINDDPFFGIAFYDSLIGWKGDVNGIKKTTNGGLNWTFQTAPHVIDFRCDEISIINKDTLWFCGSSIYSNWYQGILFKTTNGGVNWGYQIPDTSYHIINYDMMCFTDNNHGWAYRSNTGVHTKIGGNDTTYYMAVGNNISIVPDDFVLYQNYPNPFNSISKIKYKISKTGEIKVAVFDLRGKQIQTLVNKRYSPGTYEVSFDAGNLSSGIYFYSLFANGVRIETKKMMLIK
ncbi:MAG TPA: T9SS type A sorting domain-containing protein, partial [Ignavibacteria bacterium]